MAHTLLLLQTLALLLVLSSAQDASPCTPGNSTCLAACTAEQCVPQLAVCMGKPTCSKALALFQKCSDPTFTATQAARCTTTCVLKWSTIPDFLAVLACTKAACLPADPRPASCTFPILPPRAETRNVTADHFAGRWTVIRGLNPTNLDTLYNVTTFVSSVMFDTANKLTYYTNVINTHFPADIGGGSISYSFPVTPLGSGQFQAVSGFSGIYLEQRWYVLGLWTSGGAKYLLSYYTQYDDLNGCNAGGWLFRSGVSYGAPSYTVPTDIVVRAKAALRATYLDLPSVGGGWDSWTTPRAGW